MPTASISINGGADGDADITVTEGATVTLQDTGGGTPDSRTWTIQRWPAPLATAPAFSPDAISQSVTFTASTAGGYIVNLSRTDSGVTTSAQGFVGTVDSNGFIIPCAGLSGQLIRVAGQTPASQEEGWWGHARSGSNIFLDAILRQLLTGTAAASLGLKIPIIHGTQAVDQTVFQEVGFTRMDKTEFSATALPNYKLQAIIQTSDAADGAEVRLRDVTNAADIVTLGPYTNTTATFVESGTFALPITATTDFSLRIRLDTTGSPNLATIKGAWLKLES